jgi:hypothetical protein
MLGNGPVNTSRPNTRKATIEESPFLCDDLQTTAECVTTIGVKNERCFLCGLCEAYVTSICYSLEKIDSCGCGVAYLQRDSASRRRRRKGKSQI